MELGQEGPLAYDVGMNNGDDSEYYLAKGYRVVAIEANPQLCDIGRTRFAREIAQKRMCILNCGVGVRTAVLPFYVHRSNSVLSTFVPIAERIGYTATLKAEDFNVLNVSVRPLSDVIRFFGPAEFVKIDVEGFDVLCLTDLQSRGIHPQYISAEAHSIDTFCHLVAMGYREFKIVAGRTVSTEFSSLTIKLVNGATSVFSFKEHSSGPFGEDIPGNWFSKEKILDLWLRREVGWFDLHCRS